MFDVTFATIENEKQRNELSKFYSKHRDKLYSIALSKLHNEEAEDAVQDVFTQIVDKPDKFFEISAGNRLAYAESVESCNNYGISLMYEIADVPSSSLRITNGTANYRLKHREHYRNTNLAEILGFVDME